MFEKCSRRVQRELNINIDVFWNGVSIFKRKLISAVAKEVKDDVNSMTLTVKYRLTKTTIFLFRCYRPAKFPNNSQHIYIRFYQESKVIPLTQVSNSIISRLVIKMCL